MVKIRILNSNKRKRMEDRKTSDYSDVEHALFQIAVGNTIKLVPESFNLSSRITRANSNQAMYQWNLFVRAFDETDAYHRILEKIVSKVTFQLDRTFVNNTVHVLEAPFNVHRIGYGEFDANIRITFVHGAEYTCDYHLNLQLENGKEETTHQTKHLVSIPLNLVFKRPSTTDSYYPIKSLAAISDELNEKNVRIIGTYRLYSIYEDRHMNNEENRQELDVQSQNSVIELDDKNLVFLNVYYTTVGKRPLFERNALKGRLVEVCGTLYCQIPNYDGHNIPASPYMTVDWIYPVSSST